PFWQARNGSGNRDIQPENTTTRKHLPPLTTGLGFNLYSCMVGRAGKFAFGASPEKGSDPLKSRGQTPFPDDPFSCPPFGLPTSDLPQPWPPCCWVLASAPPLAPILPLCQRVFCVANS